MKELIIGNLNPAPEAPTDFINSHFFHFGPESRIPVVV